MTTIAELGSFLTREQNAATPVVTSNGDSSSKMVPGADAPPRP
jgi:hypothetical protein